MLSNAEPEPAAFLRPRIKAFLVFALLSLAVYGPCLRGSRFFFDDEILIAKNHLLQEGWRGIPAILSTGYWQAVEGTEARVQEYRPLLMLSFLAQTSAQGLSARDMRITNVLLHALVCLLLWEILKRKIGPEAALAGSLVFAVMPVHSEAVSLIVGRSEVLSAALLLGSWLLLEKESGAALGTGSALYLAAVFTKESSVVFPVFIALHDWVFGRRKPWRGRSLQTQSLLWATTAAAIAARFIVLSHPFHGGAPYFPMGRLPAAFTFSQFSLERYLWPAISGLGLCSDYSRPLLPDLGPSSIAGWLSLASLMIIFGAATWELVKNASPWTFWILGPVLFLLPTSNLIISLDTIGAERFLYFPSIALAAGWGFLYQKSIRRWPKISVAALCALTGTYAVLLSLRSRDWASPIAFEKAAIACNPVSSKARGSLGAEYLKLGEISDGLAEMERAIFLNPRLASPYYNLGRFYLSRNRLERASVNIQECLRRDPRLADAWVVLGLVEEKRNHPGKALGYFLTAARINPRNADARFNAGRLEWLESDFSAARENWEAFLRLEPADPQASALRALLKRKGIPKVKGKKN
ncbi:MAG: tetratricopeptide repeat protein [Elusimicrobiota bacterium]